MDGSRTLDPSTRAILDALPFEWLVVLEDFRVLDASASALDEGLTADRWLTHRAVRSLVTDALLRGADEVDIVVQGTDPTTAGRSLRVRACPLGEQVCALLLDDVSDTVRLDAMRRDFIVNVSHELKTPVGALMLLAEAVREAGEDAGAQQRFVERIRTEAERLSRLVNDLSDLSRLQTAEAPQRGNAIPLTRVVAEAIDAVRLIAQRRDIRFETQNLKGLRIEGSEEQLVTAVRNLLTNAVAYSPEGTQVRIAGRSADELVEISVTDEGVGIGEQDLERIFERFYRVDPSRGRETGGTGLGLAIVKHICAAHGGDCVVQSKPGEGSTFTLRLPAPS